IARAARYITICVNRANRLYALVEEPRAVAPRPRSARWLAGRFEVSVRTVERDISALQQSGVPIYAQPGRTGGYCLDKAPAARRPAPVPHRPDPPVSVTAEVPAPRSLRCEDLDIPEGAVYQLTLSCPPSPQPAGQARPAGRPSGATAQGWTNGGLNTASRTEEHTSELPTLRHLR